MHSVLLILPDFGLILLGLLLRRFLIQEAHFWAGLEKLVYFVFFPALLFYALARSPIDFAAAAPLLASGVASMLCGMLLGLFARPLFRCPPMVFASQFQGAFRFNSYIGLAVAGALHGPAGVAAMGMLVGSMVPLANLAAVWMLARHANGRLARELLRNPLIHATLAGLAFNLAGLALPPPAGVFLGHLAEAAITLGLLAVGAALRLRGHSAAHGQGAYLIAVKLLAVPAVSFFVARALGLGGVYFDTALLFAALPTATSAYILAVRMGGDGPGTAWLISANTLAAMLTLPLWLSLIAV